ncbi:DUF523 domain-containing protein [Siculibacillus lacustris]|uniref:DUF523 domain-containing protein n=1 Tax=Siculibacillus lacustris TaxID=1549641 RepID=A0A4Q9VJW0_9HYPH|nr:DUF523 domain-containing protein [Siculibacillus lacustris]TBW34743.1 DUF523 domain-containing protein [Siculibacillus lacustris]
MDRILVSACLLGAPVRWNGAARPVDDPRLATWIAEGRIVSFCPECAAGLAVPRPAAEIAPGDTAETVLAGRGRVITAAGADLTAPFRAGAAAALALVREHGLRFALLAEGSPSCGSTVVADGSFTGRRRAGDGVTARLLADHGVAVHGPDRLDALAAALDRPVRPPQTL